MCPVGESPYLQITCLHCSVWVFASKPFGTGEKVISSMAAPLLKTWNAGIWAIYIDCETQHIKAVKAMISMAFHSTTFDAT